MKKILLFTSIFVLMSMALNAQVTIGSQTEPHPGAVLDLQSTKGLKLPVVNILNVNTFQLSSNLLAEAAGMMVYNNNASTTGGQGKGVYVWNGTKWMFVSVNDGTVIPVSLITLASQTGTNLTQINSGETLQLTATVLPSNATNKAVTWSVYSGTAATVNATGLVTAITTGSLGTVNLVVIRATSQADNTKFGEYALLILQTAGQGIAVGNSGYAYVTYCYPGGRGCWTTNIKEAEQSQTTYPGHSAGERGYYYMWTNAASACNNVPGYSLPDEAQWTALQSYLNGTTSTTAEKNFFFTGSAIAGAYHANASAWYAWDISTSWWSSATYQYFSAGNSFGLNGPDATSSYYFAVRCVKSN